jgi:hypothetical protein
MTHPSSEFAAARAAVTLSPPIGARERVLHRLVSNGSRRGARPVRALVLVLTTLVTTTAAAVGVSVVPRWLEQHRFLIAGAHGSMPAARDATTPNSRRAVPHAAPAAASAVPGPALLPSPDLPELPAPLEPRPLPAVIPHPSAHVEAATPAASESLLSQQVAALREASGLVATSPGLAIVRLRAFEERWPNSPLGEEAAVRLVQALVALGRDADARSQAHAFVTRYPASRRRAEMDALVSGAPLNRSQE